MTLRHGLTWLRFGIHFILGAPGGRINGMSP